MVYIVWSNPAIEVPEDIMDDTYIVHPATESLNERLKPIKDLYTQAVFIADDDMLYTIKDVDSAFRTWISHQDSAVGFFARYGIPYIATASS